MRFPKDKTEHPANKSDRKKIFVTNFGACAVSNERSYADGHSVKLEQSLPFKVAFSTSPHTENFISIIIPRGDYPTGGYTIQVKSFSWLETYPTTFLFDVNFTDPGEGVIVTEAFTNPLVLVPIGNLSAGKYVVEAHIYRFILTYDASGKPVYTPVQTLVEEVWKESFEVIL